MRFEKGWICAQLLSGKGRDDAQLLRSTNSYQIWGDTLNKGVRGRLSF
jgi:hypothetical protein